MTKSTQITVATSLMRGQKFNQVKRETIKEETLNYKEKKKLFILQITSHGRLNLQRNKKASLQGEIVYKIQETG